MYINYVISFNYSEYYIKPCDYTGSHVIWLMIGSGPLPTLIFKCRNKWCFFGTVFVHNTVCRYNRSFTSYLILWALGWHYRPAENTFFFVFTVQQRDLTIWTFFLFNSTYHMLFALCNNNGYYLLSNHNVPEHYKHICLFVYIYIYLLAFIYIYKYL